MSVRVAVIDPLPMFAAGLIGVLSSEGHRVKTPNDVVAWVQRNGRPIVLLALLTPPDWGLLADILRARPDTAVVAFMDDPDVTSHVRALSAGARGVLPRRATAATIREAVRAASDNRVILPVEVVQALLGRASSHPSVIEPPTEQQLGWLRRLHQGWTVARLAEDAGYSERMMFRLLAGVYTKLGVANRTDAIVHAHEQGWI